MRRGANVPKHFTAPNLPQLNHSQANPGIGKTCEVSLKFLICLVRLGGTRRGGRQFAPKNQGRRPDFPISSWEPPGSLFGVPLVLPIDPESMFPAHLEDLNPRVSSRKGRAGARVELEYPPNTKLAMDPAEAETACFLF